MTPELDFDAPRSLSTEVEYFVYKYIPVGVLAVDLQLYTGKWFDYRQMTAFDATSHYIDCFAESYKLAYRREVDHLRAPHVKTDTMASLMSRIEGNDPKKSELRRRLTSFWRGRQVADALGMPYGMFIDEAIASRLRYWQQRYLPKPGHLYEDRVIDDVQKRWQEIQGSIFMLAEHPTYLVQNYVGAAQQNDYHEWVFEQCESRHNDPQRIADLINDNVLPYEKARTRLGERFADVELCL